jgi:uncharacterized membrane protein
MPVAGEQLALRNPRSFSTADNAARQAATEEIEQEETEATEILFFPSLFSPFSPVQTPSSAFVGAI